MSHFGDYYAELAGVIEDLHDGTGATEEEIINTTFKTIPRRERTVSDE